jgi:hypothetical protein
LPKPRLSAYSEDTMRTIRITHYHESGYGWSFDSPDLRLTGGPANDADYEESCRHAESAVRFTLECLAEENGLAQVEEARVVHLVPTSA